MFEDDESLEFQSRVAANATLNSDITASTIALKTSFTQ